MMPIDDTKTIEMVKLPTFFNMFFKRLIDALFQKNNHNYHLLITRLKRANKAANTFNSLSNVYGLASAIKNESMFTECENFVHELLGIATYYALNEFLDMKGVKDEYLYYVTNRYKDSCKPINPSNSEKPIEMVLRRIHDSDSCCYFDTVIEDTIHIPRGHTPSTDFQLLSREFVSFLHAKFSDPKEVNKYINHMSNY